VVLRGPPGRAGREESPPGAIPVVGLPPGSGGATHRRDACCGTLAMPSGLGRRAGVRGHKPVCLADCRDRLAPVDRRPVASLRLKAWRHGARLVELLTLLAGKRGWTRERTAKAIAGRAGSRLTDEEIALQPWRVVEGMRVEDVQRLRGRVLGGLGR